MYSIKLKLTYRCDGEDCSNSCDCSISLEDIRIPVVPGGLEMPTSCIDSPYDWQMGWEIKAKLKYKGIVDDESLYCPSCIQKYSQE